MPTFCPRMVAVFRQNRKGEPLFGSGEAALEVESFAAAKVAPVIIPALVNASRLDIFFVFIFVFREFDFAFINVFAFVPENLFETAATVSPLSKCRFCREWFLFRRV